MEKILYSGLIKMHLELEPQLNDAFQRVFKSNWFIQGKENEKFEANFAQYCGAKYCIGTGNGLDSLRVILQALNIGQGDEVIVPANTFIATVLAIIYVGATPVLVDADINTFNIDISKIEEKISKKTKAIIPVHLYGRMVNMEKIIEVGNTYNLFIIEDAAQAHGAIYQNKRAGNFGIASAFSFYPGKNLGALGDAGAIVTNDDELAKKIRAIINYGSTIKYNHEYQGCNSRLDEIQAAFLNVKLKYLDKWNEKRIEIADYYSKNIQNPKLKIVELDTFERKSNVFHIYPVLCDARDDLRIFLNDRGIETNIHYPIPLTDQKAFNDRDWSLDNFFISDKIAKNELSIPLYPELTIDEMKYIVDCLNSF